MPGVVASALVLAVVCVIVSVWAALAGGSRADGQARKMMEKRRDTHRTVDDEAGL